MSALSIEHSSAAYRLDYAVYGVAVVGVSVGLVLGAPPSMAGPLAGMALAGVLAWSAMEYGLHRFVLHGLQPFARWHAEHHRRPAALIGTHLGQCAFVWAVGGIASGVAVGLVGCGAHAGCAQRLFGLCRCAPWPAPLEIEQPMVETPHAFACSPPPWAVSGLLRGHHGVLGCRDAYQQPQPPLKPSLMGWGLGLVGSANRSRPAPPSPAPAQPFWGVGALA
jgi:hypothetical protein